MVGRFPLHYLIKVDENCYDYSCKKTGLIKMKITHNITVTDTKNEWKN